MARGWQRSYIGQTWSEVWVKDLRTVSLSTLTQATLTLHLKLHPICLIQASVFDSRTFVAILHSLVFNLWAWQTDAFFLTIKYSSIATFTNKFVISYFIILQTSIKCAYAPITAKVVLTSVITVLYANFTSKYLIPRQIDTKQVHQTLAFSSLPLTSPISTELSNGTLFMPLTWLPLLYITPLALQVTVSWT